MLIRPWTDAGRRWGPREGAQPGTEEPVNEEQKQIRKARDAEHQSWI